MSASEKSIHSAILQYLRTCTVQPAFVTTVEQGSPSVSERARLKRMGVVFGFPDIVFFVDARAFCFEVKQPGKYPVKHQRTVMQSIGETGVYAGVVRSLDDVCDVLLDHGVRLRAIPAGYKWKGKAA